MLFVYEPVFLGQSAETSLTADDREDQKILSKKDTVEDQQHGNVVFSAKARTTIFHFHYAIHYGEKYRDTFLMPSKTMDNITFICFFIIYGR